MKGVVNTVIPTFALNFIGYYVVQGVLCNIHLLFITSWVNMAPLLNGNT